MDEPPTYDRDECYPVAAPKRRYRRFVPDSYTVREWCRTLMLVQAFVVLGCVADILLQLLIRGGIKW